MQDCITAPGMSVPGASEASPSKLLSVLLTASASAASASKTFLLFRGFLEPALFADADFLLAGVAEFPELQIASGFASSEQILLVAEHFLSILILYNLAKTRSELPELMIAAM